jgi:hypothetical protein
MKLFEFFERSQQAPRRRALPFARRQSLGV